MNSNVTDTMEYLLVISLIELRESDHRQRYPYISGLSTRLRGSENNNFVQELVMNTEKIHNSQHQLDTGFKHTKSSFLFGTSLTMLDLSRRKKLKSWFEQSNMTRDIYIPKISCHISPKVHFSSRAFDFSAGISAKFDLSAGVLKFHYYTIKIYH
jgi:hypothetical protein